MILLHQLEDPPGATGKSPLELLNCLHQFASGQLKYWRQQEQPKLPVPENASNPYAALFKMKTSW